MKNDRPGLAESVARWLSEPSHPLMTADRLPADWDAGLSEVEKIGLMDARRKRVAADLSKRREIELARLRILEGPRPRSTPGTSQRPAPAFRTRKRRS